MSETIQEKLNQLRTVRSSLEAVLLARLNEVKAEKHQMMVEYDAQIEELEHDFRSAGIHVPSQPGSKTNHQLADEIFEFLRNKQGNPWTTAREINRAVKNTGALTVILSDYLTDGRIERTGQSYRVTSGISSQ